MKFNKLFFSPLHFKRCTLCQGPVENLVTVGTFGSHPLCDKHLSRTLDPLDKKKNTAPISRLCHFFHLVQLKHDEISKTWLLTTKLWNSFCSKFWHLHRKHFGIFPWPVLWMRQTIQICSTLTLLTSKWTWSKLTSVCFVQEIISVSASNKISLIAFTKMVCGCINRPQCNHKIWILWNLSHNTEQHFLLLFSLGNWWIEFSQVAMQTNLSNKPKPWQMFQNHGSFFINALFCFEEHKFFTRNNTEIASQWIWVWIVNEVVGTSFHKQKICDRVEIPVCFCGCFCFWQTWLQELQSLMLHCSHRHVSYLPQGREGFTQQSCVSGSERQPKTQKWEFEREWCGVVDVVVHVRFSSVSSGGFRCWTLSCGTLRLLPPEVCTP